MNGFFKLIKKDTRRKEDIFDMVMQNANCEYSPIVGADKNDNDIPKIEKVILSIEEYVIDAKIMEISLNA